MKLSIVTTLYNSAPYIMEFYRRISATTQEITHDFEIIFVCDGSPDDSLKIAHELYLRDSKVKIVELSRNFGHHKAMATGLEYAKGDVIFLIDCDLEESPELLSEFWDELKKDDDIDVVYGMQILRKGNWFERWSGSLYYKILNKVADEVKSAENISTVRIMRRAYVRELIQYQEQGYYFGPISSLTGFNQKGYYFNKKSKKKTSYSFLKKYHMFLDSIFTFSSKPLYFIFYFGSCLTALSFLYMIYLVIRKIFWGVAIEGWTSMVVSTSFFGGVNIFFMGILSVYVLHIFREVRARPFTIIRKIYDDSRNIRSIVLDSDSGNINTDDSMMVNTMNGEIIREK